MLMTLVASRSRLILASALASFSARRDFDFHDCHSPKSAPARPLARDAMYMPPLASPYFPISSI